MVQLLFMYPFIMSRSIAQPSHKVLSASAPRPMLHKRFNLKVRFPFNFNRRWRFLRGSSRQVRFQLGNMENIVNTLKPPTQIQLISSFANCPKDLERTHEPLMKFALTGKV